MGEGFTATIAEVEFRPGDTRAIEVAFAPGHPPLVQITRRRAGRAPLVFKLYRDTHEEIATALAATRNGRDHVGRVAMRSGKHLRVNAKDGALELALCDADDTPQGVVITMTGAELVAVAEAIVVSRETGRWRGVGEPWETTHH